MWPLHKCIDHLEYTVCWSGTDFSQLLARCSESRKCWTSKVFLLPLPFIFKNVCLERVLKIKVKLKLIRVKLLNKLCLWMSDDRSGLCVCVCVTLFSCYLLWFHFSFCFVLIVHNFAFFWRLVQTMHCYVK